ncbi:hypothetical protein [Candidatus Frankia alpina]|uniref:hypothetical protein n=1 Tax=Candidatus Frankia alpina TaxID=2699483 RepID=UPI001386C4FE|nr:hypothetical protein [Candidatus Frankia alpina]
MGERSPEAGGVRRLAAGAGFLCLLTAYHLDTTGLHSPAREISSAGVDTNVD